MTRESGEPSTGGSSVLDQLEHDFERLVGDRGEGAAGLEKTEDGICDRHDLAADSHNTMTDDTVVEDRPHIYRGEVDAAEIVGCAIGLDSEIVATGCIDRRRSRKEMKPGI